MAAAAVDKFPWPAVVFRCDKVMDRVHQWLRGGPDGPDALAMPSSWTAGVIRGSPAKIAAQVDSTDDYAAALAAAGYGTAVAEPTHSYEGKPWIDANELRAKLVTRIDPESQTKFKARAMALLCGDRGDWVPGRMLKQEGGTSGLRVRVTEYASRIDPPRRDTDILQSMQQSALARFSGPGPSDAGPAGPAAAMVGANRFYFLYRVQSAELGKFDGAVQLHEMIVVLNLDRPPRRGFKPREEAPDKLTRGSLVLHVPWLEGPPAATPVLIEDSGSGVREFLLGAMADNAWRLIGALDKLACAKAKKGGKFETVPDFDEEDPAWSPRRHPFSPEMRAGGKLARGIASPARSLGGFSAGGHTPLQMMQRASAAALLGARKAQSATAAADDSDEASYVGPTGRPDKGPSEIDMAQAFLVSELVAMSAGRIQRKTRERLRDLAEEDAKREAGDEAESKGAPTAGEPTSGAAPDAAPLEGPGESLVGAATAGAEALSGWLTVQAADDADLTDEFSFQTWGRACAVGMDGDDQPTTDGAMEDHWDELALRVPEGPDPAETARTVREQALAAPPAVRRRAVISSLVPGLVPSAMGDEDDEDGQPPSSVVAADAGLPGDEDEARQALPSEPSDSTDPPPPEGPSSGSQETADEVEAPSTDESRSAQEDAPAPSQMRACGGAECAVM